MEEIKKIAKREDDRQYNHSAEVQKYVTTIHHEFSTNEEKRIVDLKILTDQLDKLKKDNKHLTVKFGEHETMQANLKKQLTTLNAN